MIKDGGRANLIIMDKKTMKISFLLSVALGLCPIRQAAAEGFNDGAALSDALKGIFAAQAAQKKMPKLPSFGPLELKRAALTTAPDALTDDMENLLAAGKGLERFSDAILEVLERRGVRVAICDSTCQKDIGKLSGTAAYDPETKRVLVPRFRGNNGLFAIPEIAPAIDAAIKSIP